MHHNDAIKIKSELKHKNAKKHENSQKMFHVELFCKTVTLLYIDKQTIYYQQLMCVAVLRKLVESTFLYNYYFM